MGGDGAMTLSSDGHTMTQRGCLTLFLGWLSFFGLYWFILVLGSKVLRTELDASWAVLGPDGRRLRLVFYLAPFVAYLIAAMGVGMLQNFRAALRPGENLPVWPNVLVFFIIFLVSDGIALAVTFASPKISDEARQAWLDIVGERLFILHALVAPLIGILVSTLVIRLGSRVREGSSS